MLTVGVLLSFLSAVSAGCDNACSGHGTCNIDGVCSCYDNWGMGLSHDSGDCSDRICPFEIAWSDTPDKNGQRHKYAECAGRGICNRDTGDCECFPGFEGKGCQRTVCPNSCSGHGQCAYIQNLPYQVTPFDYQNNYPVAADEFSFLPQDPHTFQYFGWDNYKTRGCVCDPEWGDIDCSKRMCPYGNDAMDHRDDLTDTLLYQKQRITLTFNQSSSAADLQDGKTFALTFKSRLNETFTTIPIAMGVTNAADKLDFERDIELALESLPNRVIDDVSVSVTSTNANPPTVQIDVEFTGEHVQGRQNLLVVRAYECSDGCTPKITGLNLVPGAARLVESVEADYNSYECGRRGKCNYDTGVCQCFAGYTGLACNTITALV